MRFGSWKKKKKAKYSSLESSAFEIHIYPLPYEPVTKNSQNYFSAHACGGLLDLEWKRIDKDLLCSGLQRYPKTSETFNKII